MTCYKKGNAESQCSNCYKKTVQKAHVHNTPPVQQHPLKHVKNTVAVINPCTATVIFEFHAQASMCTKTHRTFFLLHRFFRVGRSLAASLHRLVVKGAFRRRTGSEGGGSEGWGGGCSLEFVAVLGVKTNLTIKRIAGGKKLGTHAKSCL